MKNLLLGLVSILLLNFIYAQNGDCTTPSTVVQNDANSLSPGSTFTQCLIAPNEISGKVIIYSQVTSSADGTLGLIQSIQTGCSRNSLFSTRSAELFPENDCSGIPITPSATIANPTYSSTFNPEWTGLTPSTNYTVRITITVPPACSGDVREVCLNQYYPQVASAPTVCGLCATPTCPIYNAPDATTSSATYTQIYDPSPTDLVGPLTFTNYYSITTTQVGTLGVKQAISGGTSCITRTYSLKEVCAGPDLTPDRLNANNVGSGFNPEWDNLPVGTYILAITTNLSDPTCLFDYSKAGWYLIPPPVPACPTDQSFIKLDWAQNNPFPAFSPTSFSCNDGPQRIWKNIEAANIDKKGELEAFPGFIMEVITNAASDVNTSVIVSVNGTPYSYYGPGPAPVGVLDWGPMTVPPSKQLILEPFLPAGANVTIQICDARGVAQSFAYTVNDYSTGVVLKSGTATPSAGNCTSMNFTLSSPVMTWNIDSNASFITNNNDGSGTFNPSTLSVGPHTINYSWNNGAGCTITATQNITITCPVPPVPACPTDQSFIKLDWAQNNPFPAFTPTSFNCNSGPQRIWKNIEAANIDKKGELEAFPGFIIEVITNAASDVNTSVLVSVNGTPYSYYGPGPAPVGVLDFGVMSVPPNTQVIYEPFLPAGANISIQVCDARGVAQSFAYTVNDYSTGVVLKSGTATPSSGNCTVMNFTLSSPVMTWNIDNNASLITNNNDGSGTFNPSTLSAGPHTINYTWNNGAGCTITATQNITINPLVVPNSTNVSICSGSTATLTATGASVYNWYNAATAGTKVGSSDVYTTPVLSAPTSYWVSSGSGLCESARLKVDVTIKPDVVPTFNTIPAICQNAVAPLLQNPSNDSKTGTWNPSIINTSTAGTTAYVFTPTAGQCASVKTINITINPKVTPVFNLTSDICINSTGQSLPLTSDNAIPGTWVPSSIVTTNAGSNTYQFTPSAGQCATGVTETINVIAKPTANATASVITGNPILNVDFTNSSTNATTLNWDFGNGSNSTVNGNASATYSSPGTYTVTLTASNNICPDATWTQIIIVKPIDPLVVIIPNIFTPNNDQINDDYFLDVKNAETFEAAIYNRWGNELISLVHSSDKWNGKLSSGDLADEGTYFVKYKIVGYDKTVKEGVTFFHLHLGL